jgi:hypothetical protein
LPCFGTIAAGTQAELFEACHEEIWNQVKSIRQGQGILTLGFLALAAATLLTSGLQLSWLAPDRQRPVALLAFVVPSSCWHRS